MSRKLVPVSLTAALMGGTAIADVPNVAVDIAPVHSLVAKVMDGVGTPDLVIPAGASPHEYNLRPSEAAALQNADVVFWIGEDLTPWLEGAIETLAGNANVTPLLDADGTVLLDFREGALFEAHAHGDAHEEDDHDHADHDDHEHDEDHAKDDDHDHDDHAEHDDHDEHADHEDHDDHAEHDDHDDHDHDEHANHDDHGHEDKEDHAGHDDHEHGEHDDHAEHDDHDDHHDHAHGDHDPHAWLSPANAAVWLNVIAAQLSAADPDNAGTYFANAATARDELAELTNELATTLEPVSGGQFIVFHDAYQYFETAFDFPAAGAISIADAADPSPARIAEIQGRINDEGIDCVLAEPQFNAGLIDTVLEGTPANVGVIDPLGANVEPGAGHYDQLLRNMAKTLADCL